MAVDDLDPCGTRVSAILLIYFYHNIMASALGASFMNMD